MKKELDPKIVGAVVGVVVIAAGAGLYFGLRGQGDRSGPLVQPHYQGAGRGPGGGGWKPGVSQAQMSGGGNTSIPGAGSGSKGP